MNDRSKTPRKRRRNCYDRMRARWIEARRQRRADPAASAAAQMLALFAFVFGRMPIAIPVPAPYVPPPVSPEHVHRTAIARWLRIPSRYVDVALAQGTVPYALLFDHLRCGGRSREDAMAVLRQRAPDACRDWLDHVETWGLWSSLLPCHVPHGLDEDTDVRLLKSALTWIEDPNSGYNVPGPVEAGTVLKPELGGSGGTDPEDDPKRPKP